MKRIAVGCRVDTRRRRSALVIAMYKRGWIDVRTAGGRVVSISSADVVRVWEE